VQELVKLCAAKGSYAIDVNTGPLGRMPEEGMAFFIRAAGCQRMQPSGLKMYV